MVKATLQKQAQAVMKKVSPLATLFKKGNNSAPAHTAQPQQHHRRLVAVEGMSIEALISQALESYEADATRDLRKIVDDVDKNLAMKEQIRLAQQKMEQYKEAFRNNDLEGVKAAKDGL